MQAVRMFYTQPFKWICVLTGTSDPINEKNKELLNNADAILCLSEKSKNDVSKYFEKDTLYMSYVGYNQNYFKPDEKDLETIRITAFAKNSQNDNLATIMEVAKDLHDDGFDFELYLHTNLHDQFGDYDLNVLKGRFDPHDKFIKLPERFVSLVDGYPSAELAEILNNSDIFISIPMVSGSGMSIFEALRCGCWPVLSDCGISPEITELLVNFSSNFQRNDFLIPCIKTMTRGECYLSMVCPDKLKESLKNLLQNKKNIKGSRKAFSECVKRLDNSRFLADVRRIIQEVQKSKEVLCLETL
jgi:glycosyltransferase involved in cell wall biosynthesis